MVYYEVNWRLLQLWFPRQVVLMKLSQKISSLMLRIIDWAVHFIIEVRGFPYEIDSLLQHVFGYETAVEHPPDIILFDFFPAGSGSDGVSYYVVSVRWIYTEILILGCRSVLSIRFLFFVFLTDRFAIFKLLLGLLLFHFFVIWFCLILN